MIKNCINKIFPKKKGNRRGISPVIATILLIALTVSAAAIVYFVVVPLLQGKGELVLMSNIILADEDDDGNYDTIEADLFNLGTDSIFLDDSIEIIIYSTSTVLNKNHFYNNQITTNALATYQWSITTDKEYKIQEEQEMVAEATSLDEQISPYTQFEIKLTFSDQQLSLGRLFSNKPVNSTSGEGEDPTPEPLTFLSSPFVYRTATNDPSSTRGTFPTTAGYSPRLYFLVGIFDSGTRRLDTSTFDYIYANSFGAAEDYHPYLGTTDYFTERITTHTGNTILAYNDSGLYPGCVTFRGTDYDPNDEFNWPDKGIVYLFSYIYNPTDDAMDVDLSVQVDDGYQLWFNGEFLNSGNNKDNDEWRESNRITIDPGYNIITLKAADIRNDWDAQILFWDAGETDSLTALLNIWPLIEPISTNW